MNAMAISAKPPSGTRDFLPADVMRRRFVVDRIEQAYRRHGFVPLETPTMERLEVLTAKYGEEGEGLIFTVLKRRESLKLDELDPDQPIVPQLSDLALRYDLTVPLARVVAAHSNTLPRFFKRYQIQPVWRADRPQKGRFREFYQCDVDFIGTTSVVAEATVVRAVMDALAALGFDGYTIRVNDRRILTAILTAAGIAEPLHATALVAVDKLDKIGVAGVTAELEERGVAALAASKLLAFLQPGADDATTLSALDAAFESQGLPAGQQGVATLRQLLSLLPQGPPRWVIDPSLARGLSYYTGPIFEIAVDGLSGSMGGGGRYDELVGMFRGQSVPAVGFSLGLERLLVVMEERGMFPDLALSPDVMIACLSENELAAGMDLAHRMQSAELVVEVYPETAKLGRILQYAEGLGCRFVAIVGSREATAREAGLKDLVTGEQIAVPFELLADQVKSWKRG